MSLFKRNFLIFLMMALTLPGLASSAHAEEAKQCILCGMHLPRYTHVKYTVIDTGGKEYVTCGVQCGLILQLNLKNTFKSATMTDLLSHKSIPSENGWYVYKSSVITDMSPGFIGFADKSRAEQFIQGFGGQLVTYQQALEKARTGLH
jgi:nitrous oxide reductase accessory protein NosL